MDAVTPQLQCFNTLTKRELQVLGWAAEGKSNGDIGHVLNCSEGTVKKHMQHIFDKLGVETRVAAVLMYLRWKAQATEATGQASGASPTTAGAPPL